MKLYKYDDAVHQRNELQTHLPLHEIEFCGTSVEHGVKVFKVGELAL
jgi:hypothetical protein